jgi:hypothetical protein
MKKVRTGPIPVPLTAIGFTDSCYTRTVIGFSAADAGATATAVTKPRDKIEASSNRVIFIVES